MVNEIDFKLPLAHDSYLIRLFFDFQKNIVKSGSLWPVYITVTQSNRCPNEWKGQYYPLKGQYYVHVSV